MSFFLKKTKKKKGTYLQIYEGNYSQERGHVVQSCHRSLGYLDDLEESGIKDPIAYFQQEVDRLNNERKEKREKDRKIGRRSAVRNAGYFPIKNIIDRLGISVDMDMLQSQRGFGFRNYDVFSALVFSRLLDPSSKMAAVNDVFPDLFDDYDMTYPQVLSALEYMGNDYEKYVELLTRKVQAAYGYRTGSTFFDCTNFYFEIDREDGFRRKGPSKENRPNPLVGMGLLLDENLLPIGMKLFPGNQGERQHLRQIISGMKQRGHIKGRTVQVADKGLNCAANIYQALSAEDGYIFSKSVRKLPEKEKVWVFLDSDWIDVEDGNGRLLYSYKECIDTFPYSCEMEGRPVGFEAREKRIATFNPDLAKKQKAELARLAEKAADLSYSQAKREDFGEAGKYLDFISTKNDKDKAIAVFNQKKYEEDVRYAGLNMLVTSETEMPAREVYGKYHELWRIEESFRIMKTHLEARPVYLQKKETIQGHFLICYASVLLLRILQIKELEDKYSIDEILKFIRDFKLLKINESEYINMSHSSDFIASYSQRLGIPLDNLFLSKKQVEKLNLKN